MKLTEFLNILRVVGSAKFVRETSKEGIYEIYEYSFTNTDQIMKKVSLVETDDLLVVDGDINKDAEVIKTIYVNTSYESNFLETLANIIKADIDGSVSFVDEDSRNIDIKDDLYQKILNEAGKALSISNHELICCLCTSVDYLDSYLKRSADMVQGNPTYSIECIEDLETDFVKKVEGLRELSHTIQTSSTMSKEFHDAAEEWIKAYDDRKLNLVS